MGRRSGTGICVFSSQSFFPSFFYHAISYQINLNDTIFRVCDQVKQHGISVFLMPSGMLGTLLSLIDVLPLFSNTGWGQHSNLAFLEKHMGASFEKRSQPWVTTIRKEDIHSGDFLALSKIRGRWGAFETLEKWVSGAFAGHTAVCLKDEKGEVWVAESGFENEKV